MVSLQVFKRLKGVAFLISNEWRSTVIRFGCVSSRILWVKFKFSRVKVCGVAVYGPTEREIEEREMFSNDLVRVVDRIGMYARRSEWLCWG